MSKKVCPVCGNELSNPCSTYCSRKCYKRAEHLEYISKWKNGLVDGGVGNWGEVSDHIRKYLHETYNSKCVICGWGEINPYTNKVPLEIDHIDGDPLNHTESNLRLLCPNCHSLTKTYRGGNVTKGEKNGRGYKVTYSDRTKREGVRVFKALKSKTLTCLLCGEDFSPKSHTQKFCSDKCYKKHKSLNSPKPSKEELERYVDLGYSMVNMGKEYGVSDVTVKKWLNSYGIVSKTFHKKHRLPQ